MKLRMESAPTTRQASDAEANGNAWNPDAYGGVFDGTVGWDDEDEHFENEASPDDSLKDITLVKVTLFIGRNADTDGPLPDDGLAHGLKILACLNGPISGVPPKGSLVHVSVPAHRMRTPGAPVIIAAPGPQRVNGADGDFVMWHPLGHAGIRIKKDGVFLVTSDNGTKDGNQISLGVSAEGGFEFHHPLGRIIYNATGFHVLTNSGARLDLGPMGAPGPLSALGTVLKLGAALIHIEGSGISMGTATGTPEAWAKATTTLLQLSLIASALTVDGANAALVATALTKMEADIAALGTSLGLIPPAFPTSAAAVTAAVAGLGTYAAPVAAVNAGLSAAATTLPSASTQGT